MSHFLRICPASSALTKIHLHPARRKLSGVLACALLFSARDATQIASDPCLAGPRQGSVQRLGNLAFAAQPCDFAALSGRSERTTVPACHISLSATSFSSFSSCCR